MKSGKRNIFINFPKKRLFEHVLEKFPEDFFRHPLKKRLFEHFYYRNTPSPLEKKATKGTF